MKHLHYKLSAAMFFVVLLLGAAFYVIDRYSVRLYYEELSQRLNASLAMYVVNAGALIVDGEVDRAAPTFDLIDAIAHGLRVGHVERIGGDSAAVLCQGLQLVARPG